MNMKFVLPIITSGLELVGLLASGFNGREQYRLEIEMYQKQAEIEMQQMELEAALDRQTKEQNLAMLGGILDIIRDLVRTDLELNIFARQVDDSRQMQIGDWLIAKRRESCDLNNQQISHLQNFLLRLKDLDGRDQDSLRNLIYENFEQNKKTIQQNNDILLKQTETLMAKNGFELTSIKEEFRKLAGADTLKLLEQYSEKEQE